MNTTQVINTETTRRGQRFHSDDKNLVSVTVSVPKNLAYEFFRDFKNLPLFMKDLKSIEYLSPTLTRWTMEIQGIETSWDALITAERTGEMIAWESVEGSPVETSGAIWFSAAPEILGTSITLFLNYKVPGGKLTELITKYLEEDPGSLALINLRRLKCFLETGELATIKGQTSGREVGSEIITKH